MTARRDPAFLVVIGLAFVLRMYLAAVQAYVHDEINTAIPLADTISFVPGSLNLPLRGENHGALPAYVVHVSRMMFGTSPLGSRLTHVLLGLATISLIYLLTRQWFGVVAARWAAALMAFNGYYLDVSSRATAHVPHLFLVTLAVFAFSRFLADRRPHFLYGAGVSLGLAFYCKEHSALWLPVFLAILVLPAYRDWLRRPQPYVAFLLWALVIAPDLAWNARSPDEERRISYGNQQAAQATYASHLRRIGGLGLSPYPAMFYGRSTVMSAHLAITGQELRDETPEYQSLTPVLGALLLAAVIVTTLRQPRASALTTFLVLGFWSIFLFFTLVKPGNPPGRLDPVSWIWVETTLVPAVVIGGLQMASLAPAPRLIFAAIATVALARTSLPSARGVAVSASASVQEGYDMLNHVAQVIAETLVLYVRDHPLRGTAFALALGIVLGWVGGAIVRRIRDVPHRFRDAEARHRGAAR